VLTSVSTIETTSITMEEKMKIDFREFDKNELVMACNEMLKHNMLQSMEPYLVKKLNLAKYNRLAKKFNDAGEKYNLFVVKDASQQSKKHELYTRAMRLKIELNKHIEKMQNLKMITKDEANELTA